MAQKVFFNNDVIEIEKAAVPITDGGLLYGAGLFETMRSYNETVFALDDHLDRLISSATALNINNNFEKDFLTDAVSKTLQANNLKDARIRLTLTSGSITALDNPQPNLLITAAELQPYPRQYYDKGVLVVLSPYRQNPTDPTTGHKTLNYYSRLLALNIAHQNKAAEALWFTNDSRLAEGCISNVFIVKDSKLYTPPVDTPILPGIIRKTVCKLAQDNSIELIEKNLSIDDCLAADEIFITNSIMEIMPVHSLEKHQVGDGEVGNITKKLSQYLKEFIEKQCGKKS